MFIFISRNNSENLKVRKKWSESSFWNFLPIILGACESEELLNNLEWPYCRIYFLYVVADCYKNNSLEYRGAVNFTVSGRSCQYWNVQHPHIKLFSPFDEDERTTNYCRDFPNYIHGTPWCYTGDADFRFEFCPVVKCLYFIM